MTKASPLPATVVLATTLLVSVLAAGCAARSASISELKAQPDRYDDKTVSIKGTVTSSFGIPLVPFQAYNVDDGTGEILVLSRSGRAPSRGAQVEVKGKLNELAVFGGRSLGLHIDESDRRVR